MFDSGEELHFFDPGGLTIAPQVADAVPDVGEYFLAHATRELSPDQERELEAAVNGRRHSNGWFPLERLDTIGGRGFWRGPLTYLSRMTTDDEAIVLAWASNGLHGDGARQIEATTTHLLHHQGHGAAATWVLAVRPQGGLKLAELAEALTRSWDRHLDGVRPKDVMKSIRRWNT